MGNVSLNDDYENLDLYFSSQQYEEDISFSTLDLSTNNLSGVDDNLDSVDTPASDQDDIGLPEPPPQPSVDTPSSNTDDVGLPTTPDEQGVEVYRLYNNELNLQFYTTSQLERDTVLENLPQYEFQGISFIAAPEPEDANLGDIISGNISGDLGEDTPESDIYDINVPESESVGDELTGVSPVYRLFNSNTGVHLYTISEVEKDFVVENLPNYNLEGIEYYGYNTQVEETIPLYRFYNSSLDAHFYTPSMEERDEYIAAPEFQLEGSNEGIAFYVQPAPDI